MLLLFLISLLFGETKDLHFQERDSILYQAKKLSLKIKEKVNEPNQTSVWLFIKPEKFETLSLQVKTFKEIGFDGVDIGSLLQNPPVRLDIDSKWGTKKAFSTLCSTLKKEELSLIGSIPIGCTGPGADFKLALHHYKDYPSLYELISIDEALWPLLPEVKERMSLPLNQDTIALLANEGILKKSLEPNTYYSVTKEISCIDGKIRRYIYLHLEENPLLNFESPLFTAQRLLAGELLFLKGKQDYVRFTGMQNKNLISEELTLLAHTLGQKTIGECSTFKKMKTDLCDDLISRTALVHSFLTQDASFLRLITLHQTSNTFVHRLEGPFSLKAIDDHKIYRYKKKDLHGEEIKIEVRKDLLPWTEKNCRTTFSLLGYALKIEDFDNLSEETQKELKKAHLLLTFYNAMQGGVFELSNEDLLGTLPNHKNLYGELKEQLNDPFSFASSLKKILLARKRYEVKRAKLEKLLTSSHPSLYAALYSLADDKLLILCNFAKEPLEETFSFDVTALDIVEDKTEKNLSVSLDGFGTKALLLRKRSITPP